MEPNLFALSYDPGLVTLFMVLGMGPARSGVWVDDFEVRVQMGWGFRAVIPRAVVRSVVSDEALVTGWGVHGWRSRWLVNGSSSGMVRIEIDPAVRGWAAGVPVQLRTLRLSVAEPTELMRELRNGTGLAADVRDDGR